MIRISQVKLPVGHGPEELKKKAARILKTAPEKLRCLEIRKQSVDARKKPELYYTYTVDVETAREGELVHKLKNPQVTLVREQGYGFPEPGKGLLKAPPVIVGAGPAGLFCGLMLARAGYGPVILERGADVDVRRQQVDRFWATGELDVRSNVQFGEGGAGTFSDGKLNTLVKDPVGRNRLVLKTLVEFGADPAILYQNKPHIGTDVLGGIVKQIRQEIIRLGGTVTFGCQVTDLAVEDGKVRGVVTEQAGKQEFLPAGVVVLAIGHSARDTFGMLVDRGIPVEQKAFAVGLRIQHPQEMVNLAQYGTAQPGEPGAASYKLTCQTGNGRGVYSFCMCPGGYVVNASSEPGLLAVNGMSYHARSGENANSALIVTVGPEDFGGQGPLAGVEFQRRLERLAYQACGGRIPVQILEDFQENRLGQSLGDVKPETRGAWEMANLRELLPKALSSSLLEAMGHFGQVIRGFDRPDAVLAGVESRTSSPVRIPRGDAFESRVLGLYPCGEGAGYAGGITSAAMDGVKVAEAVAARYRPSE